VYLIRLKHRHLENLEVLLRFWTNSGNFGRNEQKGMIDVCVYLNYRQGYSWLYFEWERSDVTQYILLNAFFCCKITFIYYFYPYQRAQEWRFAVTSLTTKPVDFSGLTGTSFCEQVSRGPHFGFRNICLIGNRMIRKGLAGANLLLPEVTTSVLWCVAEWEWSAFRHYGLNNKRFLLGGAENFSRRLYAGSVQIHILGFFPSG